MLEVKKRPVFVSTEQLATTEPSAILTQWIINEADPLSFSDPLTII